MVLSDGLDTLIELYQALQAYTKETIEAFAELAEKAEKARKRALFNKLRATVNADRRQGSLSITPRPEVAAAFMYLNLRGFNGLVRQNKAGDFNMTIGRSGYKKKDLRLPSKGEILDFARALHGAVFARADFASVIELAGAGDVVYADPPYDGTFTGYSTEWGKRDQQRLAEALEAARGRGAYVFASNADTPYIRELYKGFEVEEARVNWQVGGRKDRRIDAKEVLLRGKPTDVKNQYTAPL